jgi:murein DD-endopeptidase MepM/ murein hydrolase activator NlpD
MSAQTGTVSQVFVGGWNGGYGTHVLITGTDGNVTLYAHMSGVNVNVGQAVTAGATTVGWVGMTGRTTGPHLHFEVKGANPLSYLP